MRSAFVDIVRTRGFRGLYAGLSPTLVEIIPYAGLQFGTYDTFKRWTSVMSTCSALSALILHLKDIWILFFFLVFRTSEASKFTPIIQGKAHSKIWWDLFPMECASLRRLIWLHRLTLIC